MSEERKPWRKWAIINRYNDRSECIAWFDDYHAAKEFYLSYLNRGGPLLDDCFSTDLVSIGEGVASLEEIVKQMIWEHGDIES